MEYTFQQLEMLIQSAAGNVVIYEARDGGFAPLLYTKNVPAFSGLTEDEYLALYGKDAAAVVSAADMAELTVKLKKLLAGAGDQEALYRTFHKTKGFVWTHVYFKLLGTCEGVPVFMGNFMDVSATTAAPDMLLDNSDQKIYVIERGTYDLLYANCVAQADKTSVPKIGQTCYQYVRGLDAPCANCVVRQLRGETPLETTWRDKVRGKSYEVKAVPMNFFGKQAYAFFIDDLTKHLDLEEQLRQEQEKYRAATEGANLRVYEYDIRNHTITLPEHSRKLFGVPEAFITNVPDSVLPQFQEEDRERVLDFFSRVDRGEQTVTASFRMREVDGYSAYLRYTFTTSFDRSGAPVKAYAVAEDITAQKRAEEEFDAAIQAHLVSNPNALCSYKVDLTQNRCSEGHGTSEYIRRMLRADTADKLFLNLLSIIPDAEQRDEAASFFNRSALLDAFAAGTKTMHLDYQRTGENDKIIWVRTYINMLKHPETQDVISVFYSLDISADKRQQDIFDIITGEEYDYVALLHADANKIEFLNVGGKLLKKYHDAFNKPGQLFDFDKVRLFAADSWIDREDREYYLQSSDSASVRRVLDRSGHCDLSVRGHYTGHPDEFMCRKIQHYYLGKDKDTILIIQTDVTTTYMQQVKETQRAKTEFERLSDILNGLTAGICVLQMPDAEHVRTSFCNRQMYRLLDIAPNASTFETMDKESDKLVSDYFQDEFSGAHPDDLPRMRKLFRAGYAKQRFTVTNVRLMGGKGKYKHITIELVLRDKGPDGRVFYAVYRDVSEEVSLQRELDRQRRKQMELTLVDTIGSLPANYVLYRENKDGRIIPERYSDEFCQMKGCTQTNIRNLNGEDGFEPVHPDDRGALEKAVRACSGDNLMHHAEYRIRTMNGGYKWVSVNYSHFSAGAQRYLYAIYTDIDELKKQERQLEEQYNTALAFLDSASDTYLATQRVNLTKNLVESVSGRDPLDMRKKTADYDAFVRLLLDNMPRAQDRRNCAASLSRASLIEAFGRGEKSRAVEYMVRLPDGSVNWVRKNITLAKRPESEDIISFAAVNDINEERLTVEIMERIVSKQFDYVGCINAETGRLVLFFSKTSKPELNGIKPGMAYEATLRCYNTKYASPDELESILSFMSLASVRSSLSQRDRIEKVYTCDEGDGMRVVQAEFFWLDRENGLIVFVRTDITETQRQQLEHEKALRAALSLAEEANRAKTDFLSRMSHDIRTPLNGIIGMTYLTGKMDLPAAARDNLGKIDTSSKFLLGLINDVLDMSKAESGKLELHPEPYQGKTFAGYLEAVIAPLCREKDIKFITETDAVPGVDALVDPLRVNQVFFNLLSNAVKFTPEGGTVTMRVREKPLGQNRLSITAQVSDTGIGMSEEFRKILFDPFTQENRRDISEGRGTGLGLAIAKKIIDAMGGTITVESRINEGTTFTVHADVGCVEAKAAQQRQETTSAGGKDILAGKHILLCEDHPLNQEIAVALLTEKKMTVSAAEDGKIGAEMFRRSTPGFYDAILMDIRMPVMDGYEATKVIRRLNRADAKTVPIIAMTADAFSDDVRRCLAAGMNGHIAKPIEPEILYLTLRNTFAKEDGN